MASTNHVLLSPAELAYLHASLSLQPPLRPDGRAPAQFRPLVAETDILPGTNGSARICFADGTEAIVGVKAEVERTKQTWSPHVESKDDGSDDDHGRDEARRTGNNDWVELTVEISGYRDDEPSTMFLSAMLSEALLADGTLTRKLWINTMFHWKLYLDVCCLFPPPGPQTAEVEVTRLTTLSTMTRRSFLSHLRSLTRYRFSPLPPTWPCSPPGSRDSHPRATRTRCSTTTGPRPCICTLAQQAVAAWHGRP